MKRPPKRPAGALTWGAAVKVAKQKGTIYKVKKNGELTTNRYNSKYTTDAILHAIQLDDWKSRNKGYLFDNYMHALAYQLRCKQNRPAS